MPKQKGAVKFLGTIGDLSFYKSKDGFLMRSKASEKASIKNNSRYKRTMENATEFSKAISSSKQLRAAFRPVLTDVWDFRIVSRMNQVMSKIGKTDPTNDRGLRKPSAGNLALLKNFEFNSNSPLNTRILINADFRIDRSTGESAINLPGFSPFHKIISPDGATHCKIFSGLAMVNFELNINDLVTNDSDMLDLNDDSFQSLQLTHAFPAGNNDPIFAVLGIAFYQSVNNKMYPMSDSKFNAASIIGLSIA